MENNVNDLVVSINKEVDSKLRDRLFSDLIITVTPHFNKVKDSFLASRGYRNILTDESELFSAYLSSVERAVVNYDSNRGDFMARVTVFSGQAFTDVAKYHMANMRFGTGKGAIDLNEELATTHSELGYNMEVESMGLEELISTFIATDKEGEVIDILLTHTGKTARSEYLTKYYGQYSDRERKRVERVRTRFKKYLLSSGYELNF